MTKFCRGVRCKASVSSVNPLSEERRVVGKSCFEKQGFD